MLLSHLFTIAIKEWRVGLFYNPVANIRKPAPTQGRDRRLTADEEKTLLQGCDRHSNPMLGWIARVALYTGMRAGEIKSLTRRQVNLHKRTVHLTETKNATQRGLFKTIETLSPIYSDGYHNACKEADKEPYQPVDRIVSVLELSQFCHRAIEHLQERFTETSIWPP